MSEQLGKIISAEFGFGGYRDTQFGLSITLGGDSWSVSSFWGFWGEEPSPHAKWSKEDQVRHLGETSCRIRDLLHAAKAQHVSELVNKPIAATFEGNVLKSWRILAEVL